MNGQMLRTILAGALIGAVIFAVPWFALKVVLFLLIIGIFFRVFRGRGHRGRYGWTYPDKIRSMNDQEYEEFKNKWGSRCGYGRYGRSDSPEDSKTQNV